MKFILYFYFFQKYVYIIEYDVKEGITFSLFYIYHLTNIIYINNIRYPWFTAEGSAGSGGCGRLWLLLLLSLISSLFFFLFWVEKVYIFPISFSFSSVAWEWWQVKGIIWSLLYSPGHLTMRMPLFHFFVSWTHHCTMWSLFSFLEILGPFGCKRPIFGLFPLIYFRTCLDRATRYFSDSTWLYFFHSFCLSPLLFILDEVFVRVSE